MEAADNEWVPWLTKGSGMASTLFWQAVSEATAPLPILRGLPPRPFVKVTMAPFSTELNFSAQFESRT